MKGTKLTRIVEGKDYTPRLLGNNTYMPLSGTMTPAVVGLHCINANTSELTLIAIGDTEAVSFPAGSFIQGRVYELCICKIINLGGANFVGYLMN